MQEDIDFADRLTRAATAGEQVFEPSEHVELQIYGKGFPSAADLELSRRFHLSPWEQRPALALRFSDARFRRLARRLIYFERPDLLDEAERHAIAAEISRRIRGGRSSKWPWMTILDALDELDALVAESSGELHGPLQVYRDRLLARQASMSM